MPRLVILFIALFLVLGCKKDPPAPKESTTGFQQISENGTIEHIGVDDNTVYAKDDRDNLILYNRHTGTFKFINQFNSTVKTDLIVGIQNVDTSVYIYERSQGFLKKLFGKIELVRSVSSGRAFNAQHPQCVVTATSFLVFDTTNYFIVPINGSEGDFNVCASGEDTSWVCSNKMGMHLYVKDDHRALRLAGHRFRLDKEQIDSSIDLKYINSDFMYLLTRRTLFIRRNGKWTSLQSPNNTRLVAAKNFGNDLIICGNHKIFRVSANNSISEIADLSLQHSGVLIHSLDVDGKGDIWLGTSAGIFRYLSSQ